MPQIPDWQPDFGEKRGCKLRAQHHMSAVSLVRNIKAFAVLSDQSLDLAAQLSSGRYLYLSRVIRSCAYAGTAGQKNQRATKYEVQYSVPSAESLSVNPGRILTAQGRCGFRPERNLVFSHGYSRCCRSALSWFTIVNLILQTSHRSQGHPDTRL